MSVPSGRLSPAEAAERGLPEDVYINPDNLPAPSGVIQEEEYQDIGPVPGGPPASTTTTKVGKKDKLKGLFKKDKKKKETEYGGSPALADVMGRTSTPSRGSSVTDDGQDTAPVVHPKPTDPDKSSRMASFREFFKKKPGSDETKYSTGTTQPEPHTSQTVDSMRSTMRNFFYGPPAPSPPMSPTADDDIAPLKAPPRKSPCRMSIILFVIFGLMVIIGITLIVVGAIGDDRVAEHCKVLGPIFLLLGCFLIIGEVFFMLFWVEDPLPCMKDCMEKVDAAIGGVKDPYGLKRPETYQPQRKSYHPGLRLSAFIPPTSPTAKETIPMKPIYSGAYDPEPGEPMGPAALSSYPPAPGYQRDVSLESHNSSYQNTTYQDDSFTAGRLL